MKRLFLIVCVIAIGCTKPIQPTPEELASASFGPSPELVQLPSLVRTYLKKVRYRDPNGAEIESCTPPQKDWTRIVGGAKHGTFAYGWKFLCDVNGVNKEGGHTGFESLAYFASNGEVVQGQLPMVADRDVTFFTPNSQFQIWK